MAIAIAALHDEWPSSEAASRRQRPGRNHYRLFAVGTLQQPQQAPLHLLLRRTNFQIKVWEALLKIPGGEIVSYQTLAAMIGSPRARRVVGTALAQNRIALLIPCHRVIRESGGIGQYRWGSERKSALLASEAVSIGHGLKPGSHHQDTKITKAHQVAPRKQHLPVKAADSPVSPVGRVALR